ncbi:MAG: hypothetical protein FIA92_17195 [Chloroflexi bacterium]|nr:hypothetical protein [Chloroflexota bacterium]
MPQPKSGASPGADATPTAAPPSSPASDSPPTAPAGAAGGPAPTEPPGSCHASGGTAAIATRHLVRPSLVARIFVAATLTWVGNTARYRLQPGDRNGGVGLLISLSGGLAVVTLDGGTGSIAAPAFVMRAGPYVVGFFVAIAASNIPAVPVAYSRATCS